MNGNTLKYCKLMVSGWLLTLALLFSLYSLPGSPILSFSRPNLTTLTFVRCDKPRTAAAIVFSERATRCAAGAPIFTGASFRAGSLSASRQTYNTKYRRLARQFASIKSTFQFYYRCMLPQNAGEDFTNAQSS